MKANARNIGSRRFISIFLFGATVLVVGLIAVAAITKAENQKATAVARKNAENQDSRRPKKVASSGAATNTSAKPKTRALVRGDFRPGQEAVIPDSRKLTLEQAKNDTSIKFRVPKVLPDGTKLEIIYRIPGDGQAIQQEIVQGYDVNGKPLGIGARPIAQAPDFKMEAERGSVWVSPSNSDGTIMKNPDGSQKWVRMDNTKFITVNGIPGTANEPTQVKSPRLGADTIRNPGVITWYANGTLYTVRGDMPVSQLLKIAESMD
ncbi:MAG: DUF4367 domain-containing protein [Actinobacteria bacterium]|nr:DUF4367 domain-containing protein [Actinomycetota bacterium]